MPSFSRQGASPTLSSPVRRRDARLSGLQESKGLGRCRSAIDRTVSCRRSRALIFRVALARRRPRLPRSAGSEDRVHSPHHGLQTADDAPCSICLRACPPVDPLRSRRRPREARREGRADVARQQGTTPDCPPPIRSPCRPRRPQRPRTIAQARLIWSSVSSEHKPRLRRARERRCSCPASDPVASTPLATTLRPHGNKERHSRAGAAF